MSPVAGAFAKRVARALVLGSFLVAGAAAPAVAFDPIVWSSVDGGGRFDATGGAYHLAGTIGQHDAGVLAGGAFALRGGFWGGGGPPTADAPLVVAVPLTFQFRAPAPNPVHSLARLSFDLPATGAARLSVHDVSGRTMRTLDFGTLPAGRYEPRWSAVDDAGRPLPSGVDFRLLEAGTRNATKRVLVLR